jgi:hypothetical protein
VLALAEPLLLVIVGVGLAVVMRTGPMDELGSNAPVIKADGAPMQQTQATAPDGRTPPQFAPRTVGSSVQPDLPVDVATDLAWRRTLTIPAAPTSPMIAASASLPDPPKPAAESSMFGAPQGASTVSIKAELTDVSKGTLEAAPLPPTRPRTLASTDTTVRARPSDARPNAAGASSFSIQLASSHSKSDALAILSRLKKRFSDVLGGGSIRRFDGGGTGAFYRVQAGPLSRVAADEACSRLKASGENCIVVHS